MIVRAGSDEPSGEEPENRVWLQDGSCTVPSRYPRWSWRRLRRVEALERRAVIFTVDAGLDPAALAKGLGVLRERGVKATYFLMTGPLQKHPQGAELLRRIVADGHELANHTVSHPKLTRRTDAQIRAQIEGAAEWVREVTGKDLRPFFREPYLDRDKRVDRVVRQLCYRSVWHTIYTRDDEAGITAHDIIRAVLRDGGKPRQIDSGSILLFHASQKQNLLAWPAIISELRARGYEILPLGEAL